MSNSLTNYDVTMSHHESIFYKNRSFRPQTIEKVPVFVQHFGTIRSITIFLERSLSTEQYNKNLQRALSEKTARVPF